MSYVTEFTGTNVPTFYTQDRRVILLEEFGYDVDKFQIDFKNKWTVPASGHLQDFMDALMHKTSK